MSGGLLKTVAPGRIGSKLEGITHICDWSGNLDIIPLHLRLNSCFAVAGPFSLRPFSLRPGVWLIRTRCLGAPCSLCRYATWCALAGVDPTDERGAKAGLPPVDGVNLWPYISGETDTSPRTEVFASPTVLVMEINGTKWKLFGDTDGDPDGILVIFSLSLARSYVLSLTTNSAWE